MTRDADSFDLERFFDRQRAEIMERVRGLEAERRVARQAAARRVALPIAAALACAALLVGYVAVHPPVDDAGPSAGVFGEAAEAWVFALPIDVAALDEDDDAPGPLAAFGAWPTGGTAAAGTDAGGDLFPAFDLIGPLDGGGDPDPAAPAEPTGDGTLRGSAVPHPTRAPLQRG